MHTEYANAGEYGAPPMYVAAASLARPPLPLYRFFGRLAQARGKHPPAHECMQRQSERIAGRDAAALLVPLSKKGAHNCTFNSYNPQYYAEDSAHLRAFRFLGRNPDRRIRNTENTGAHASRSLSLAPCARIPRANRHAEFPTAKTKVEQTSAAKRKKRNNNRIRDCTGNEWERTPDLASVV